MQTTPHTRSLACSPVRTAHLFRSRISSVCSEPCTDDVQSIDSSDPTTLSTLFVRILSAQSFGSAIGILLLPPVYQLHYPRPLINFSSVWHSVIAFVHYDGNHNSFFCRPQFAISVYLKNNFNAVLTQNTAHEWSK